VNEHDGEQPGPARVGRLARELGERDLDVLLVDNPVDVRYLTGFTGTAGLALVAGEEHRERLGPLRFLTDFRYATQSGEQLPESFQREIVAGELLEGVALALADAGGRLGFDEAHLTVKAHGRLRALLGDLWELVPCAGAVAGLRAIKEPAEIARMRAAAELADEALRGVLDAGMVGRTEREVAIELELRMRRLGAEAPSFPSIVAAGANAALPHAVPHAQEIPRDVLVTVDWGALLDGYCSDCTRTYATGEGVSGQAREIYELVLDAQKQGLAAVKAGPTGREVDAVAREVIDQGGHGAHFGHGLGHGVGLEVHEGPYLNTEYPGQLAAGNVVTIEPGVYLSGVGGVRIEDLAIVTDEGLEVLTTFPKTLTTVR
jgi:Xaa-Pro aminopeptidase